MNSHELALKLLDLPDGPVPIDGELVGVDAIWHATFGEVTTVYLELDDE